MMRIQLNLLRRNPSNSLEENGLSYTIIGVKPATISLVIDIDHQIPDERESERSDE